MLKRLTINVRPLTRFVSKSVIIPELCLRANNLMKSWQIHNYGNMRDIELNDKTPIPTLETPDDILVKVQASSVNPLDVMMIDGYGATFLNSIRYFEQKGFNGIEFPLTLGRDFSGVVVEKGHNVKHLKMGDEVWGTLPPYHQGAHAQFVKVSNTITKKPSNLSHIEAAAIPYAGVTAWSVLKLFAHIWECNASQYRVLVLGCSGGVGHILVQILSTWGAEVVGICGSQAIEAMESLHFGLALNYNDPDFNEQLEALGSYDVIIDSAAANVDREKYHKLLKPGKSSRYVTLSSPLLRYIDSRGLVRGGFRVLAEALQWGPSHRWGYYLPVQGAMDELYKLAITEQLKPLVAQKFKFNELPMAYDAFCTRRTAGKIVISLEELEFYGEENPV